MSSEHFPYIVATATANTNFTRAGQHAARDYDLDDAIKSLINEIPPKRPQRGGRKRRKKTRKKRGGIRSKFPLHILDIDTRVFVENNPVLNNGLNDWWSNNLTPNQRRLVMQMDQDTLHAFAEHVAVIIHLLNQNGGGKRRKKTRKKRGGEDDGIKVGWEYLPKQEGLAVDERYDILPNNEKYKVTKIGDNRIYFNHGEDTLDDDFNVIKGFLDTYFIRFRYRVPEHGGRKRKRKTRRKRKRKTRRKRKRKTRRKRKRKTRRRKKRKTRRRKK